MKGTIAIIVSALFLVACQDRLTKAEEQLAFIEKSGGTLGQVCEASREVERAAAEKKDADRFQRARVFAGVNCQRADLVGADMPANEQDAAYSIEPDNLDALPDTTSGS